MPIAFRFRRRSRFNFPHSPPAPRDRVVRGSPGCPAAGRAAAGRAAPCALRCLCGGGTNVAAARARPSHVPARAGVIDGIFQQHFQYWPQYMPLSEIEPGPFTVWLSQLRLPTAPKQSS